MNTLSRKLFFLFSTVLLTLAAAPEVSGQWVQVGITGHAPSSFAVIGSNIFAGTDDSGVFLSTDSGSSWASAGLASDHDVWSMAALDTNLFVANYSGVFRSTNNGSSWASADSGLPAAPANFVNSFAVIGTNLFAEDSGEVYVSTDSGTSWNEVSTGMVDAGSAWVLAVTGTTLFEAGDSGISVSFDSGKSWSHKKNADIPAGRAVCLLANGTNLFAGFYGSGVMLSTDSGASWVTVSDGLPTVPFVNAIAVFDTNLFTGTSGNGGSGVFLSTNNGTTWKDVNSGLTDSEVYALVICGRYLFAGTGSGVWRSHFQR